MSVKLCLYFLLFASITTRLSHAQSDLYGNNGASLLASCKTGVASQDNPDRILTPHELLEAGICIAYVQGYLDGIADAEPGVICIEGHSPNVIIRVYVNFMEANPLYLDAHRSDGFLAALFSAFPCKPIGPKPAK